MLAMHSPSNNNNTQSPAFSYAYAVQKKVSAQDMWYNKVSHNNERERHDLYLHQLYT